MIVGLGGFDQAGDNGAPLRCEQPHKNGQRVLAHDAFERIGELFAIERTAIEAGDSPPERGKRRQRDARPILDGFRIWCDDTLRELLPKSPTAQAIGYTLKHWAALTRYLDDGAIAIDNNATERALREIAVGLRSQSDGPESLF